MSIDFNDAKIFLTHAHRWELKDHFFKDTEFGWDFTHLKQEDMTAGGYAANSSNLVWIKIGSSMTSFSGDQAKELQRCGTLTHLWRNDDSSV